MSRDGSGNYTLPLPDVITGTVIEASWANTTLNDIKAALTDSLSRSGAGGMSAAFKLVDGTVGAPGLGFNSEANTGLYRAASQDARFAVNGVDRMRWSTANGVQIFETTWKSILKGAAGSVANTTLRWNNTTGQWDATALLKVNDLGTETEVLTASLSDMTKMLLLTAGSLANGGNIRLYGRDHATNSAELHFYSDGTPVLKYGEGSNEWDFSYKKITGIEEISLVKTIKLDVAAAIHHFSNNAYTTFAGGNSPTSGASIVLYGSSHATTPYDIAFRSDSTLEALFDYSDNAWNFQSNSIKVGALTYFCGTDCGYDIGAFYARTYLSGQRRGFTFLDDGSQNSDLLYDASSHQWSMSIADTIYLRLDSTGLTLASLGTGTVYSNVGKLTNTNPSDERLKKEIKPIYSIEGLDLVRQLSPVSFRWLDSSRGSDRQYGLIAQEVEQVLPELVAAEKDGYLGIKSDQLVPFLIAAIRELADRVDELERNR